MGRAVDLAADDGVSAARRADPAALGQATATAHLAQQYLFGLAWGILPALWFLAIRGFMGAVNRPEPILWITLAAIPANAVLVYLLLYGAWGLPRLGLFGAGLATSIVNLGTFLAGLWFATRRRPFRKYHVLGHIWRIDWGLMRQLIIVGAPISIVVPAGIRPVRRRRTADGPDQHHGAGGPPDRAADRRHPVHGAVRHQAWRRPCGSATRSGAAMTGGGQSRRLRRDRCSASCLVSAMTLAVILGPLRDCADFPRRGRRRDGDAWLTATLLLVGATFFIADGIQTVAAGALRGMNDTRVPLLFAAISYWLIGFPLRLRARLLDAARRGRRLDRAVGRHRGLRHPPGLALPHAREQIVAAMTVHEVTPDD